MKHSFDMKNLPKKIFRKVKVIKEILEHKKVLVALSGGLDSIVLSYLANSFAKAAMAITVKSEITKKSEIAYASQIAQAIGIKHRVLDIKRFNNDNFMKNTEKRCYYCKKETFTTLKEIARKDGYDFVIEGSNVSELGEYRPGLKALEEEKIISPFLEANMTKEEIRYLARVIELESAEKPSNTCLITRLPYYEEVTTKKLKMARLGEKYLKNSFELHDLRVRVYGGILARIEIKTEKFNRVVVNREDIVNAFKNIGFKYVTLDLAGIRSGSMDDILDK